MCKVVIYSDEKFTKLQKQVYKDLELTPDNVQHKILEIPKLYTKYNKLYLEQRRLLKNINTDIKKTKAKRFHYYKFGGYDYSLDNTTERTIFVEGDDEMCDVFIMHDRQAGIVEFLKNTVGQITQMSYLISSYVDLEKMRNGKLT